MTPLVAAIWYLAVGFAGLMLLLGLVSLFQGKTLHAGILVSLGVFGALGILYFGFGPGASIVSSIYYNVTATS